MRKERLPPQMRKKDLNEVVTQPAVVVQGGREPVPLTELLNLSVLWINVRRLAVLAPHRYVTYVSV